MSLFASSKSNAIAFEKSFTVVVARSQDSSQPLLVVVPVADTLDNFAPDDSFADDSRHVWLDNWQRLAERMAVVDLDTVANRYSGLVAVQALALLGVVNSELINQTKIH